MCIEYGVKSAFGRAMAQVATHRPLTARVRARVNPMGFVVDKVALGQVFLRVLSFHRGLHISEN
jgi:hypothetical protein